MKLVLPVPPRDSNPLTGVNTIKLQMTAAEKARFKPPYRGNTVSIMGVRRELAGFKPP